MRNLISGIKAWEVNSVLFFLPTIWWLDALKRREKIVWENAFEQNKKKLRLKFNPRFIALIGHRTSGPTQVTRAVRYYPQASLPARFCKDSNGWNFYKASPDGFIMPVNQKKVGLLLTWKSEEDDPDHKSVRILSRHASSENVLNRRFNLARCFFTSTWTRSLFVKIQQRR